MLKLERSRAKFNVWRNFRIKRFELSFSVSLSSHLPQMDSPPGKIYVRNASWFVQLFDVKFPLIVAERHIECQFLRQSFSPVPTSMKNVFNGRPYVSIRETLGNLEALSSLVKSLFPAARSGNLEMKRLRDKISRHRQQGPSLIHCVTSFARPPRHSGRGTEVSRHAEHRCRFSRALSRESGFIIARKLSTHRRNLKYGDLWLQNSIMDLKSAVREVVCEATKRKP